MSAGQEQQLSLLGTSFLDEDPEQGVCAGDRLAEVVIVVDGQQVAVHVRVADGHLGVGDVMGVHNQLVEVFELSRLLTVQGEPSELSSKLQRNRQRVREQQGKGSRVVACSPDKGAFTEPPGGLGHSCERHPSPQGRASPEGRDQFTQHGPRPECRTGAGAQFVGDPHLI